MQINIKAKTPLYNSSNKNFVNSRDFILTVHRIYDKEFLEQSKNILISYKKEFFDNISYRVKNLLSEMYSDEIAENEKLLILLNTYEKQYETNYNNYLKDLNELMEISKKNKVKGTKDKYITNFRKHCSKTENYATHNCNINDKKGYFLPIYNKEHLKYVICMECYKVFLSSKFLNFCSHCKIDYYSNILDKNENPNLMPAAWKNYHCKFMINQKINCSNCNGELCIDTKYNILKCPKCKNYKSPKNLENFCNICRKKYLSEIIIYNPLEKDYLNEMLDDSIIIKNRARPTKIPCCNNINVTDAIFYHNKNCKGNLYFIQYHKNLIIGCEKCKQFYFKDKFIWTCPSCGKEFKEQQSESKEINNLPKSDNINLSKKNYLNEKFNKYIYNKEKNELNEMVIAKKNIDNEKNINNANNNINNKKEPQVNVLVPRKNRKEISVEFRSHQNIDDASDKKGNAPNRKERRNKISNRNDIINEVFTPIKNDINNDIKNVKNFSAVYIDKRKHKNINNNKNIEEKTNIKINSINDIKSQILNNNNKQKENEYESNRHIHILKKNSDMEDKLDNYHNIGKSFAQESKNDSTNDTYFKKIMDKKIDEIDINNNNYLIINRNWRNNDENNRKNNLIQRSEMDIKTKNKAKLNNYFNISNFSSNRRNKNNNSDKESNDIKINMLNKFNNFNNSCQNISFINKRIHNNSNNDYIIIKNDNYINNFNNNPKKYNLNSITNFNKDNNNKDNILKINYLDKNDSISNNSCRNININNYKIKYYNNINNSCKDNNKDKNNEQNLNNYNLNQNNNIDNKINRNQSSKYFQNIKKIYEIQEKKVIDSNRGHRKQPNKVIISKNDNHFNRNNSPKYKVRNNIIKNKSNLDGLKPNEKIRLNKNEGNNKLKVNKVDINKEKENIIKKEEKSKNLQYQKDFYNKKEENSKINHYIKDNHNQNNIRKEEKPKFNKYIKDNKNQIKGEEKFKNNLFIKEDRKKIKKDENIKYNNNQKKNDPLQSIQKAEIDLADQTNQNNNENNINEINGFNNKFKNYQFYKNKIKENQGNKNNGKKEDTKEDLIEKIEKEKLLKQIESAKTELNKNKPDDVIEPDDFDFNKDLPIEDPFLNSHPDLFEKMQKEIKKIILKSHLPIFDPSCYYIEKKIGEGTYGAIFQVINLKSKKKYAMKKIITNNVLSLKYLKSEFEITYENIHPHILNIYGINIKCFDSHTFSLCVLMDLAETDWDMAITERFKTKKNYTEQELVNILKQLESALIFLQRDKKIAHRDIKPENVLIFKNNNYRLADFGEAKAAKFKNKINTLRGTDIYMSPLLYNGLKASKEDVQHNLYKSDVFSLGYSLLYAISLNYDIINELRDLDDEEKIKAIIIKRLKPRFSDNFIELILRMINPNEQSRIDFIGLDKLIKELLK